MKKVPIAEFKAHCSRYIEEVGEEDIVITKHGKAVARLVPAGQERDMLSLIGALKGRIIVDENDDLLSTGLKWDAES